MLFKTVVFLILFSILLVGNTSGISRTFKTSVDDKELKSMCIVLDTAILNYYNNHSELPEEIDENILHIMGLSDYDWSNFTYHKLEDNKYTLTTQLSDQIWTSSYSNKELPIIESEKY